MEPAPGKHPCSCGSLTHLRRSSLQCPFNSKWDDDDAKRAELAAAVALQRREAGIDEDDDDVLDLDGPAGANADLGDDAIDAIGSPAYAKARRVACGPARVGCGHGDRIANAGARRRACRRACHHRRYGFPSSVLAFQPHPFSIWPRPRERPR